MKHDNYDNPCKITLYKKPDGDYLLRYDSENYELLCSEEELLEEIQEHINLMKGEIK